MATKKEGKKEGKKRQREARGLIERCKEKKKGERLCHSPLFGGALSMIDGAGGNGTSGQFEEGK